MFPLNREITYHFITERSLLLAEDECFAADAQLVTLM